MAKLLPGSENGLPQVMGLCQWGKVLQKMRVKEAKASPMGWIAPCLNTSLPKFLLVMLMTLPSLMGLWED
ncbi:hypothetical protein DDW09_04025 [Sulfolobus sp. SCGC AB-777_L09]|nr:hypothetical protein DDW09_04025 [Sulfolobus sp. SCGC AB-777_L09]